MPPAWQACQHGRMTTVESTTSAAANWWYDGVGYEVYIRSFADGDGDGVGDLAGITERLEHLAWLGVSVVWITPFYPSPMHDHGYDVADYVDVDRQFGTLDDFDRMIAKAHELGLKVVIDIVPNHSSSEHEWFQQARSSKDSPYRDYYVWRDPAPDGGPPNNWVSHFGGPAWTLDEATGQYWLHLFLPEQPDLNWRNPKVLDEFDKILTFWLERGVDGFRIDVAQAMVKHPDFPDLPEATSETPAFGPQPEFDKYAHVYDLDQEETKDVFRRWRELVSPYDALLLGELYILEHDRFTRYFTHDDGLHLGFWFKPMHSEWDVDTLRVALEEGARGTGVSWVLSSHDRSRAATRFGGGDLGRARSLALSTVLMGLPGVPFIYQGEELGMTDGFVPPEQWADPIVKRTNDPAYSRDGCRTPMLWEPADGWGFTTSDSPWLPYGDRRPEESVAGQQDDPGSYLHRYRALVALRNADEDLRYGAFGWLTQTGPFLAYQRGNCVVVANTADTPETFILPFGDYQVAFGTDRSREGDILTAATDLQPAEAMILRITTDG